MADDWLVKTFQRTPPRKMELESRMMIYNLDFKFAEPGIFYCDTCLYNRSSIQTVMAANTAVCFLTDEGERFALCSEHFWAYEQQKYVTHRFQTVLSTALNSMTINRVRKPTILGNIT